MMGMEMLLKAVGFTPEKVQQFADFTEKFVTDFEVVKHQNAEIIASQAVIIAKLEAMENDGNNGAKRSGAGRGKSAPTLPAPDA